jgi:hypothetical protein
LKSRLHQFNRTIETQQRMNSSIPSVVDDKLVLVSTGWHVENQREVIVRAMHGYFAGPTIEVTGEIHIGAAMRLQKLNHQYRFEKSRYITVNSTQWNTVGKEVGALGITSDLDSADSAAAVGAAASVGAGGAVQRNARCDKQ